MKKISLAILVCGMVGARVYGQNAEKQASANFNCPGDMWIYPDTIAPLYLSEISSFYYDCNGFPGWGGETVYHFTAPCTNIYTLTYQSYSYDITIAWRIYNWNYCDSTGYTCLTPAYLGNNLFKIDLALDSTVSYDIIFENDDTVPIMSGYLIMNEPHVSNIQFYDITPDSISVSWDGSFDDMEIEYGPRGFTPGNDTIAGTNGILLHNPSSPFTFHNLVNDSVYDFYFRSKCGVYSSNSQRYRKKTAMDCNSIPIIPCDTAYLWYYNYDNSQNYTCSWALPCGWSCPHDAPEKIWQFTPDSTGIYTIRKYSTGSTAPTLAFFYKEASLGCNEHNWNCLGIFANSMQGFKKIGPLTAGISYYLMIKGTQDTCSWGGMNQSYYGFYCPSSCYSPVTPWSTYATSTSIAINSTCFYCEGTRFIEYGLAGFTPGTDSLPGLGGTILTTLSYSDTIIGLIPGTAYDFYCRQYCDSAGAFSENAAKNTISTLPVCSTAPVSINIGGGNDTICSGQAITLSQVGGTLSPNGAFHWYADSCGGNTLGTLYWINITPAVTTTYYVRAEDSCGVTACASITINVLPAAAPPTITGITAICQGASTILTASPGYACYQWSIASTTQSINVSSPGTYTVTVCNANGCTATASAIVTVYPMPIALITGNDSICSGNCTNLTIIFTGTPPFTYSYTQGSMVLGPFTTSNTTATIIVCPAYTATYTVTSVTDAFCTGTGTGFAIVTVYPLPTPVITGQTAICPGGSSFLTPGMGYTSYLWLLPGGIVSSTLGVVADTAGVYIVIVTDANGCIGSDSVTVVAVPNPVAVITPSAPCYICLGDTVNFTANTGTGYSYQWLKNSVSIVGAVNSNYGAFANGFYSCLITDSNSCYDQSPATLVQVVCLPAIDPDLRASGFSDEIVLVPNPASYDLTIQTARIIQSIKIFDLIGQNVFVQMTTDNPDKYRAGKQLTINIINFSKGIYFIEVNDGKEKAVKKFVKE